MNENPYQAPQSQIHIPISNSGGIPVPAGKWRRFFNAIIDQFLGQVLLGMAVGFLIGLSGSQTALEFLTDHNFLFGIGLSLVYFIVLEGAFGITLGKLITGTKVVDENGGKPSFGQILGRTFARIIPFEAFSFLADDGRGWHDSLPKTYVVRTR